MTDSAILGKCVEYAIQIMQFIDGKENFLALGKIILCCLLLGGA